MSNSQNFVVGSNRWQCRKVTVGSATSLNQTKRTKRLRPLVTSEFCIYYILTYKVHMIKFTQLVTWKSEISDSELQIFSMVSTAYKSSSYEHKLQSFPRTICRRHLKCNRFWFTESQYLICISGLWAGWGPTPVCKSKSSRIVAEVL